jgi:putative nucleotidyltransferase with HDIG domain
MALRVFEYWSRKNVRREQIHKDRPDSVSRRWDRLRARGVPGSLVVAAGFVIVASLILSLREEVVPYRPGEWVAHDIVSRVNFEFLDRQRLADAQNKARLDTPHVYTQASDWKSLEQKLIELPDRVASVTTTDELPRDLRGVIDSGALTKLKEAHSDAMRPRYTKWVQGYIAALRRLDSSRKVPALVVLSDESRLAEVDGNNNITIQSVDADGVITSGRIRAEEAVSPRMRSELEKRLSKLADENFELALQPKIVALTLKNLAATHALDESASTEAQNAAANQVALTQGQVAYKKNQQLVPARTEIDDRYWQLLRKENERYISSLDAGRHKVHVGLLALVLLVTVAMGWYIAKFQPRVIKRRARAIAIAGLLLSMLLLAQLAGVGTSPLYIFGLAPTLLVAMILAIAYDQRFAAGVAALHGVLVTIGLGQDLSFLVILLAGSTTCCYLLDDIRTRSKLIEVGGAAAGAMMLATVASGLIAMDPLPFIGKNCLYAGAAGIGAGFIVLGILPFIEKAFRITTSMTLLELADASHPLLRRLAVEAPGTYNHSLQVATIAEAAAEIVKGNSLLCRVASYYHDVGKINKAEYFCENQADGANRHLNLTPSVSLLIIIGHVKDGIELAREYNLPTSIFPFIQQHHGTTLVEFFYQQALSQQGKADHPIVSETQYRYPGPKPRTRESAIVMIADAVESATRAMQEPTAGRIEALVRDIAMNRLLDGQFDECDLSMRELLQIQRSCVKSLLAIYHGRIAYPSSAPIQTPAPAPAPSPLAIKTA